MTKVPAHPHDIVEHCISQATKAKRKKKLQQALSYYYRGMAVCNSSKLERLTLEIEDKILKKNHPDKYKILHDFSNAKQLMHFAKAQLATEARTLAARQLAASYVLLGEYQKAHNTYSTFTYFRIIDNYFMAYTLACLGEHFIAFPYWQALFGTEYETRAHHFLAILWPFIKKQIQEQGKFPFRLHNQTATWLQNYDSEFIEVGILYLRQMNKQKEWSQTIRFVNKFIPAETADAKTAWLFAQALYWRALENRDMIPPAIDYLLILQHKHNVFEELGLSKKDYGLLQNDILDICCLLAERNTCTKTQAKIKQHMDGNRKSGRIPAIKLPSVKDSKLRNSSPQALPEVIELPSINPFEILKLSPSPAKAEVLKQVAMALKLSGHNMQNIIQARQIIFEEKHKFLLSFLYAIPGKPVYDVPVEMDLRPELPAILTSAS